MKYSEEIRDLFTVPDDYYLAHCISADFGMGKGIVVEFNKRFDLKNKLVSKYGSFVNHWDNSTNDHKGSCILEERVFNLITKSNYWNKPTYDTLTQALKCMRILALHNNIEKIAMSIISCGLDRLQWGKVSEIIKEVFADTDVEILVCKQN